MATWLFSMRLHVGLDEAVESSSERRRSLAAYVATRPRGLVHAMRALRPEREFPIAQSSIARRKATVKATSLPTDPKAYDLRGSIQPSLRCSKLRRLSNLGN